MVKKLIDIDKEFEDLQNGFFDEAQINKRTANIQKNKSAEMREKVSVGNLGQKRSLESKQKMSEIQKQLCQNRIPTHLFDPKIHKKASDKQKGIPRPQTSAKLIGKPSKLKGKKRPNISNKLKGKPKSEAHKAKMRKPKLKYPCTVCGNLFAPNILVRFHHENCKKVPK